jgi:hypothetical protein
MGALRGGDIALALVPALILAALFFFDHNVSSQLAQQQEFGLRKPPAYHYDLLLLGARLFFLAPLLGGWGWAAVILWASWLRPGSTGAWAAGGGWWRKKVWRRWRGSSFF